MEKRKNNEAMSPEALKRMRDKNFIKEYRQRSLPKHWERGDYEDCCNYNYIYLKTRDRKSASTVFPRGYELSKEKTRFNDYMSKDMSYEAASNKAKEKTEKYVWADKQNEGWRSVTEFEGSSSTPQKVQEPGDLSDWTDAIAYVGSSDLPDWTDAIAYYK